jgi:hypothetical protein
LSGPSGLGQTGFSQRIYKRADLGRAERGGALKEGLKEYLDDLSVAGLPDE